MTIAGISPNNAHKGDAVDFSASGQGRNVSYHWDFGDNNAADGSHVNHSYTASGSYIVTVIITDAIGQTSSGTQSIMILPTVPTASFTASTNFGFSVNFDGSASSADSSQTIANYHWDFGDGATDDTQSSFDSHTYIGSGPYTVTLTVTDSSGQKGQPYQQQVTPQQ